MRTFTCRRAATRGGAYKTTSIPADFQHFLTSNTALLESSTPPPSTLAIGSPSASIENREQIPDTHNLQSFSSKMAVGTISYDEFYGTSNANSYGNQQRRGNRQRRGNQQHRRNQQPQYTCRARQLTPRLDLVQPGQAVALDCEGVELPDGSGLGKKGLGQVSVVNESGGIIYDTFAYYPPEVRSHAPPRHLQLGVYEEDLQPEVSCPSLSFPPFILLTFLS